MILLYLTFFSMANRHIYWKNQLNYFLFFKKTHTIFSFENSNFNVVKGIQKCRFSDLPKNDSFDCIPDYAISMHEFIVDDCNNNNLLEVIIYRENNLKFLKKWEK